VTPVSEAWLAECRVFCRYLARRDPEPAVLERYAALRASLPAELAGPNDLDRLLLAYAVRSPGAARRADAYTRLVAPASALRQALVLMLAILECVPPTHRVLHSGRESSRSAAAGHIVAGVVRFGLVLAAALLVIGPRHLLLAARGGRLPAARSSA
jgi:hypothetical protein